MNLKVQSQSFLSNCPSYISFLKTWSLIGKNLHKNQYFEVFRNNRSHATLDWLFLIKALYKCLSFWTSCFVCEHFSHFSSSIWGRNPSSIYSWSISQDLEHEFFCLGRLGSSGPSAIYSESIKPLSVLHSGLKREW